MAASASFTAHALLYANIKGTLCSFGEESPSQNFNIYSTNEVIIQTQND